MYRIFKTVNLICCLYFAFFLCGCNDGIANIQGKIDTENVMTVGDRISAVNDFGDLTITAGNGNKRYLTVSGNAPRTTGWLGDTVSVKLKERKARYRGSLGLYCDTNVKKVRIKGGGGEPTNIKMEEAQLHFDTLEAAEEWVGLIKFDETFNSHVWTSDGLYVRWEYVNPEYWIFPKRTYLYILVFQLYVGGDKISPHQVDKEENKEGEFPNDTRFWYGDIPSFRDYPELLKNLEKEPVKIGGHKLSNLPGASDDKIKVEHLTHEQLKSFEEQNKIVTVEAVKK